MYLVLERLAKEAPYISCSIEPLSDEYFDRLSSGDMDFSVAAGNWRLFGADEPGSEIKSELLFSDTFVCIVAKNHPAIDTEITKKTRYGWMRANAGYTSPRPAANA